MSLIEDIDSTINEIINSKEDHPKQLRNLYLDLQGAKTDKDLQDRYIHLKRQKELIFGEQKKTKKEKVEFKEYEIVEYILSENHIRTIEESGEMRLYEDNYYKLNQVRKIKKIISDTLKKYGLTYNIARSNTLIQLIQNETLNSIKQFDKNPFMLNLNNGFLNIQTGKFTKHTHTYLSSRRIPITYDPEAECPNINKFLIEVFFEMDLKFILEFCSLCLTPIMIYQTAVMLYGAGNNGKTTFLNFLSILIGINNCSKVDPSQLNKGHISWTMENSTLNFCSDIETKKFAVRKFNQYVGNDLFILIDRKFKDPYLIPPTAKLLYTCNDTFPNVDVDTDKGFWRKWKIIICPNAFDGDLCDKDMLDKLTTPNELSGFLNICIQAFQNLHNNKKFTNDETWEDVKNFWFKKLNVVSSYISDNMETNVNYSIDKNKLLSKIIKHLYNKGISERLDKNKLTRKMHQLGFNDSRTKNLYYGLDLKNSIKIDVF